VSTVDIRRDFTQRDASVENERIPHYDSPELTTHLFIDGDWCAASSANTLPVFNPARPDELVGHAADATPHDVDRACSAAHKAFPRWAALTYAERADYLIRIAQALQSDAKDLEARTRLFTREHGKILKEAALELSRLGQRFVLTASYAQELSKEKHLPGPPFDTVVYRQPRGVAALIVPWNWPLSILGAKLPQALLAGNTVVIKPSRESCLTPALTIGRMAEMLPPGVINMVTGSSAVIGDPLLTHPLVRKINFTGSIGVGRRVMVKAAENLTPVTLELGGNDAGLVLNDACLDEAAFQRMFSGIFLSSGQICMALKRLYVHESRYDDVVAGLTKIAERQVIGDGLLPEVSMGPLNNREQFNIVRSLISEAKASGCDVRECGSIHNAEEFEQGYFVRPTFVLNPDQRMRVVTEEQFGPVIPIMSFADDEEAIDLANATNFGLCSSVWCSDNERAMRVARRLEAGYTYLNAHGPTAQDNRGPFGGFKHSGIGRNLGFEGVVEFQDYHTISSAPGWLL
jgi:acyl-CoA reductase-like NAD-dependent aldehyde dehydrogenase